MSLTKSPLPSPWQPAAPRADAAELLYLHPSGHCNDLVIPAGALTCMNAAPATKLGRYAFEVGDDEIATARVIAIDLHWALAIPGFARLVDHVRAVKPDATIVAGGISAGFYVAELLAMGIDYVVRGDAERPFAELVDALLSGRQPRSIANVHCVGQLAPPRYRPSQRDLDAIDSLTADWFPTYARCSNWDAGAFPAGRLLIAARGCESRCPECYGSYASTFSAHQLTRSPAAVARDTARAAALKLRNLRYYVGRPHADYLSELCTALAGAGPFAFSSGVGFYMCRAPGASDIDALEAAFTCPVAISMIPPDEHRPRIAAAELDRAWQGWRDAATHVDRSARVELDAWATTPRDSGELRRRLLAGEPRRVKVSCAATWAVTRPTDQQQIAMAEVAAAVDWLWSFYAARILSPALAELLVPFALLDELEVDPASVAAPADDRHSSHAVIMDNWHRHALPTLPGLRFSLAPIRTPAPSLTSLAGLTTTGALELVMATAELAPELIPLESTIDHRGVCLRATLPPQRHGYAFVAHDLVSGQPMRSWNRAHGSMAITAPACGDAELVCQARVHLQGVSLRLTTAAATVAEGSADLGYFPYRP